MEIHVGLVEVGIVDQAINEKFSIHGRVLDSGVVTREHARADLTMLANVVVNGNTGAKEGLFGQSGEKIGSVGGVGGSKGEEACA